MDNFIKTIGAFLILALFITISWPSENIVSIESYEAERIETISKKHSKREIFDPVVNIYYVVEPFGQYSSATGFSIKYDKKTNVTYFLTNDHFCEARSEVPAGYFYFEDSDKVIGKEYSEEKINENKLTFIASSAELDLCLLSFNGYIRPAKMASKSYKPKILNEAITVGAPQSVFPVIETAYVSGFVDRSLTGYLEGDSYYFLSGIFFGGQSGSPVYNKDGKVFGILFMRVSDRNGGGMYGGIAIPITDIYRFLEDNHFSL